MVAATRPLGIMRAAAFISSLATGTKAMTSKPHAAHRRFSEPRDSRHVLRNLLAWLLLPGLFTLGAQAITNAAGDDAAEMAPADLAAKILDSVDVGGGLIVHVACGRGHTTAALGARPGYVVQGLDTEAENVRQARQYIQSLGKYGPVSADQFNGSKLPYADNLVTLLVADKLGKLEMAEVMRVLQPGGVACIKQEGQYVTKTKPRPENIDSWTHYLHDASGNAVAADDRVSPPKHIHWVAAPYWSRSHEFNPSINAAVCDGRRMFYTLDEGTAGMPDSPHFRFPARWSLIARDAFSGVELWKRPIPKWGYREWNTVGMWSAPLTLQRRLVADENHIYFTFGYRAPVSVVDSTTGKTVRTLPDTTGTDEVVLADGVLLLLVREQLSVASPPDPEQVKKRRRRLNPHEWQVGPPGPAALMAVETESGKVLWQREPQPVTILTLASDAGKACFHSENQLICVDLKSGKQLWAVECPTSRSSRHSGGTLVMHDDVVLYTSSRGLTAFALADGRQLWQGPKVQGPGVSHPPDLFVAGGLVWGGYVAGTHQRDRTRVVREGRDPRTGKVKQTIEVANLISPMHHFRCYRSKATDRYLLLTKRGVEFLDIHADDHMRQDWLRAGCSYGFMPCNGMLYVTPHHCFCYPGVKLNGFLALAGDGAPGVDAPEPAVHSGDKLPLQRGPAYATTRAKPTPSADKSSADWPTYRHDSARSGRTTSGVPQEPAKTWEADIGGKLVQPIVASGKLFVAQVDGHTIHALDAADGSRLWSYTAGARIDSPPTFDKGRLLFGSRDGWVYCLRANDGMLAWRFRAAPHERRIVGFDQVESAWPVPGSVLIQKGVAYVVAGRSSFLDGGVRLYGLDPTTGKVLHQTSVEGPWPDPENEVGRPFDMEGTKGDLLVGDGQRIYLFQMVFDNQLRRQEAPRMSTLGDRQMGLHLMSTGGFVDYQWYDRTYWTYSRRWPGFYYANDAPKAGQILVFDDQSVYGLHVFRRRDRLSPAFTPGEGYELFADDVNNEPALTPTSIDREKGPGYSRKAEPKWSREIFLRVHGMVLADDKLLLAGPPDIVSEDDPYASFEGRLGAKLWVVSSDDGEKLTETSLDKPPVFDGMIAAGGRVYLSTTDGKVVCLK